MEREREAQKRAAAAAALAASMVDTALPDAPLASIAASAVLEEAVSSPAAAVAAADPDLAGVAISLVEVSDACVLSKQRQIHRSVSRQSSWIQICAKPP